MIFVLDLCNFQGMFIFLVGIFLVGSLGAEVLSLDLAIKKALLSSPTLRVSQSAVGEKEGDRIQAGAFPNPVAGWSVENVYGNKDWNSWDSAENRYELAQLIELGGKRGFRMWNAEYELYAAKEGFEVTRVDLFNRLYKLFVAVAAAQELLIVSTEQQKIDKEALDSVSAKYESGKISLIQKNKAEIALANAEVRLIKAQVDFDSAKERLSLLWGNSCADFDSVDYQFYKIIAPRELGLCVRDLKNNPELIQLQFLHYAAHQNWNLENSRAIPDVAVTVGYKTLQDTGNKGMILGASVPLPVYHQNQGNIHKARATVEKSQDQLVEMQVLLENKLSIAHRELSRAYQEARRIQDGILISANQAFDLAKTGYVEGKFEYLEMLDAQRTLFEVKERYIQSLLNYHQRQVDIEFLTSRIE